MLNKDFWFFWQNKLEWIRREMRSRRERDLMMRPSIQVAMETSEKDKQYLLNEIARQNHKQDNVNYQRTGSNKHLSTDFHFASSFGVKVCFHVMADLNCGRRTRLRTRLPILFL